MSYGIINDIAPMFRPYVQTVYEDLKLGLCKTKVDFERLSGTSDGTDSQFRLVLPYCSKKLKWEVLFDPSTPWFAPDFRFDDESFLSNVDDNFLEAELPSLANWNGNNPNALSDVISELIELYKNHQIRKLNEDESSRAFFEYSALLGDALTSDKDIEVWVGNHVVEFLIRLNVDTSRLPELYTEGLLLENTLVAKQYFVKSVLVNHSLVKRKHLQHLRATNIQQVAMLHTQVLTQGQVTREYYHYPMKNLRSRVEENPGIDTALLLVRYPNSTNAELIMSPLLTKSLGNITLPPMLQSGVLMDYVPMVTELLNNKIQELLNNEKFKRNLLAQLIVKYEGAVLEHDANNAAFLFQTNDFHWILQIDIGARFPEKPPILTLRSVYHSHKGKPKFKVLNSCPYNNFESYIEQQVEIFKNECKGLSTTNHLVNVEN